MNVRFANCNSIEEGTINIKKNKLNIKYAINGTGKTTIAKAIELWNWDKKESTNRLIDLKPFKYREDSDNKNPVIEGLESVDKVAIFNQEYIDQYVFAPGELIKNSFDIFIRDERYEQGIEKINIFMQSISNIFRERKDIEYLLRDLNDLSACFGKSKGLSKASSFARGLKDGNKISNIPEGLEDYEEFIRHEENVKWIQWQLNGGNYIDISNKCPYCISSIDEKKETILAVKDEYDAKLIEHLNKVIGVVERLKEYLAEDTYKNIIEISQSVEGLKIDQENYLLGIRSQIDGFIDKLESIKELDFTSLKDFDKIKEYIINLKIDLRYFNHLNSESTANKVEIINGSLDEIISKIGELQGEVNKQKCHIEDVVKIYGEHINDFLRYAGYDYYVELQENKDEPYKLKLKHKEFTSSNVDNPEYHLSFGEKNAIALILFMFDALKQGADLIILDDPVSSFDKNKKFATINMLFRGKNSLRGKTVLMLTHDFEPIVDIILHSSGKFEPLPEASYLENKKGVLEEKTIKKSNIKTYAQILMENIENHELDIIRLIYLRRFLEFNNNKNLSYQLLSNLFKKREIPTYGRGGREMSGCEIEHAVEEIREYIPHFNYESVYEDINNQEKIIDIYKGLDNNYEKLQIYRLINPTISQSDVIKKFVNESYHIENDYLYQLNPCEYEIVPQYIIDICDKDICSIMCES